MLDLTALLTKSREIPVITLTANDDPVTLAKRYRDAGITTLEITLRNEYGLKAINAIAETCPDITVGAGTVLNAELLQQVEQAGGQFAVSPGFTLELLQAAKQAKLPLLPGIATISEAMTAYQHGFSLLKLFPAETVNGLSLLKALNSVMPFLKFCPTGGINANNKDAYLALPNVVAVGGSWLEQTLA